MFLDSRAEMAGSNTQINTSNYPPDSLKKAYRDFAGIQVVETLLSNAGGMGLIPDWGTKNPHVLWPKIKT